MTFGCSTLNWCAGPESGWRVKREEEVLLVIGVVSGVKRLQDVR